jgi:hypothetical protein
MEERKARAKAKAKAKAKVTAKANTGILHYVQNDGMGSCRAWVALGHE